MHSQAPALTEQCACIEIGDGYLSLFLPLSFSLSFLLSFFSHIHYDYVIISRSRTQSCSRLMKTEGGGGATALCFFSFLFLTMPIALFLTLLSLSFCFNVWAYWRCGIMFLSKAFFKYFFGCMFSFIWIVDRRKTQEELWCKGLQLDLNLGYFESMISIPRPPGCWI